MDTPVGREVMGVGLVLCDLAGDVAQLLGDAQHPAKRLIYDEGMRLRHVASEVMRLEMALDQALRELGVIARISASALREGE